MILMKQNVQVGKADQRRMEDEEEEEEKTREV
jgi:hypothetical protein